MFLKEGELDKTGHANFAYTFSAKAYRGFYNYCHYLKVGYRVKFMWYAPRIKA